MSIPHRRSALALWLLSLISATIVRAAEPFEAYKPPPGRYETSWVGNSFGGSGGSNGAGFWVQDAVGKLAVTPDGTAIVGAEWDEAGRCIGFYKDGSVNQQLLKLPPKEAGDTWGWGTSSTAIASTGENLFAATSGKRLVRFRLTPAEPAPAAFIASCTIPDKIVALAVRDDLLLAAYSNRIETRSPTDLHLVAVFPAADVHDIAIAPDHTFWIISGHSVRHLAQDGRMLHGEISGRIEPSAISFDIDGRLIVCDNGPDQQVKFFDVSGEPRQVEVFGARGGCFCGVAGAAGSNRLFGLRGAGTDAHGNLYIAMAFGSTPNSNLILRSFDKIGKQRWELMNLAFVDTFGFDPQSDGSVVYSRTAILDLDLNRTQPGSEWRLGALTLDPLRHAQDPRLTAGCTTYVRRIGNRRALYTIGQYAGGYHIFAFDSPDGGIAHEVDHITGEDQWAWYVADNGDIWHGDAPGKCIRRYPCLGWQNGQPRYDWGRPEQWPWPDDFQLVRRITYEAATDSLYLFGYLQGEPIDSWGVVGRTGRRYDGWTKGHRSIAWTAKMPTNPHGSDKQGELTPNSIAQAGDYLFVGMVKPDEGRQFIHILRAADAAYVGSLTPGAAVGNQVGWLDMPYAVQAIKRHNGEYLVLAEEDFRGKNLLYRWRP